MAYQVKILANSISFLLPYTRPIHCTKYSPNITNIDLGTSEEKQGASRAKYKAINKQKVVRAKYLFKVLKLKKSQELWSRG